MDYFGWRGYFGGFFLWEETWSFTHQEISDGDPKNKKQNPKASNDPQKNIFGGLLQVFLYQEMVTNLQNKLQCSEHWAHNDGNISGSNISGRYMLADEKTKIFLGLAHETSQI